MANWWDWNGFETASIVIAVWVLCVHSIRGIAREVFHEEMQKLKRGHQEEAVADDSGERDG